MWKSTPALPTNTWYPVREAVLKAGLLLVHVVVDQGVEAVADLLALGEGEQGVLALPLDLVVDHLPLRGQASSYLRYCSLHNKKSKKLCNCSSIHFLSLRMMRYAWGHVYNFENDEVTCTTTESTKSPETLADCRTRKRPSLKPPSRRAYIYKYKNTTTDPAKMDQEELFF